MTDESLRTPPPKITNSLTDSQVEAEAPRPRLCLLRDVVPGFRAEAEAAYQARVTGVPRGPISGLKNLDKQLAGAFSPGVHVLHGNTGTGKTALALQIAASCCCPAVYVSCEMSPVELLRRHTARITKTFLEDLKSGTLRPDDAVTRAMRAIEAAPQLAFVDATQAAAPPDYVLECAHIVKGRASHLLIVIDSLHTWTQTLALSGVASEYEVLNAGIRSLQILASRLACPVLMICERNRDSIKSGGVNAGAGTRKIEYQGESVLDLDRKTETLPDGAGEVEVSLKLAKNRHGAAGKAIRLRFHGAFQRFEEAE